MSEFAHFFRRFLETEKWNPQTFSLLECMSIILVTNIYWDIRSYQLYSDIRSSVCQSVKTRQIFEYIRIFIQFSRQILILAFVRVNFLNRIYSNIHSCPNFHECHSLFQTGMSDIIAQVSFLVFSYYLANIVYRDIKAFSRKRAMWWLRAFCRETR